MATNDERPTVDDNEDSQLSHTFTSTSKIAHAQVRETVKDNIFPIAKFLRLEDMPYSTEAKSWCQKMASWCHIDRGNQELWWHLTKRVLLMELQHQRANKTNIIKREFFSK